MAQNRERRRMHDEEKFLFGDFVSQSVIGLHHAEFRTFCEDKMLVDVSDVIAPRKDWRDLYSAFLKKRNSRK